MAVLMLPGLNGTDFQVEKEQTALAILAPATGDPSEENHDRRIRDNLPGGVGEA